MDTPFYTPDHRGRVRQAMPGELLFEFYVERTKQFWRCELRDHGEWGVEAQFFEGADFTRSHRFQTRALAVQWAELERKAIEP